MALALVLSLVVFYPGAGTAGFDFLRITPTAREAALGGAPAVGAGNGFNFYYNPAGIATGSAAHIGYINYPAGIHAGSAGYSQPVTDNYGVGVGVFYLNSGRMKRTNEQGEELGTFGVSYANLNLSGGIRLPYDLAFGLGLNGLYGGIDSFFSLAVAANIGISYQPSVLPLKLGFVVQNLGGELKPFGSTRDPLPLEFRLGGYWEPIPALNLNLALAKPIDNRFNFRAGIEGWVTKELALRAGYSSLGADLTGGTGWDPLAGFSIGLGIRYQRYQLDYCFVPMVVLGSAHRISLGFAL